MEAKLRTQRWLDKRPKSLRPWLHEYGTTFQDSPGCTDCAKALKQLDSQGFIDVHTMSKLKILWKACREAWPEYSDLNELWPTGITELLMEP